MAIRVPQGTLQQNIESILDNSSVPASVRPQARQILMNAVVSGDVGNVRQQIAVLDRSKTARTDVLEDQLGKIVADREYFTDTQGFVNKQRTRLLGEAGNIESLDENALEQLVNDLNSLSQIKTGISGGEKQVEYRYNEGTGNTVALGNKPDLGALNNIARDAITGTGIKFGSDTLDAAVAYAQENIPSNSFNPEAFAAYIGGRAGFKLKKGDVDFDKLLQAGASIRERGVEALRSGSAGNVAVNSGVAPELLAAQERLLGLRRRKTLEAEGLSAMTSGEEELNAARRAYFERQRGGAESALTQKVLPSLAVRLNEAGRLRGPGLGVLAAKTYSDVLGSVDEAEMQQAESDAVFFADMAFQAEMARLVSAGQDARGAAESRIGEARQQQDYGFRSSEAALNRKLEDELSKNRSGAEEAAAKTRADALEKTKSRQQEGAYVESAAAGVGKTVTAGLIPKFLD